MTSGWPDWIPSDSSKDWMPRPADGRFPGGQCNLGPIYLRSGEPMGMIEANGEIDDSNFENINYYYEAVPQNP